MKKNQGDILIKQINGTNVIATLFIHVTLDTKCIKRYMNK